MNERITELYIQARQLAKEAADKTKYDTHAEYQQSVTDKSYDTFAELIVRECAGRVDWILAEGGRTQGDLIRKHFGVEE